jgi:serine O-acetyltransferase
MPDRPESLDQVLEPSVAALARSGDDALSKACSEGCPDWDAVVAWTDRTRQLVLRQRQPSVLRAELPGMAGRLLEILRSTPASPYVDPEWVVARFVECLPQVRACLAEDVEAAHEGDPASKSFAEIVVAYPSIQAVTVHRLAHQLFLLGVPVLARVMSEYAHGTTGIDIHPGANIGRRFFIDHGTGVVIGETTLIGDRVQIYQGVTLGALAPRGGQKLRGVKRHPTIEDDVTIYAGTTILGGETVIGRGSVIGGNVWLTHSVPPESVVLIESPRQTMRDKSHSGDPDWSDWDI